MRVRCLGTPKTVAAVVTQIAVAISDSDGAAVSATGGVALKTRKLFVAAVAVGSLSCCHRAIIAVFRIDGTCIE